MAGPPAGRASLLAVLAVLAAGCYHSEDDTQPGGEGEGGGTPYARTAPWAEDLHRTASRAEVEAGPPAPGQHPPVALHK